MLLRVNLWKQIRQAGGEQSSCRAFAAADVAAPVRLKVDQDATTSCKYWQLESASAVGCVG